MRTILVLALVTGLALAGCTTSDDGADPSTNMTNTTNETNETPTPTPEENCVNPVGPVCVTPPGY